MFALKCAVQFYDWGKIGPESEVYQLITSGSRVQTFDISKPYAELWMGTHPSGPAILDDSPGMSLASYVKTNPTCLGEQVQQLFGQNLPFLFKVLSVRKALSIQAHPNKLHAELLHAKRPDVYKDDNHKPEMAIALTPFEALLAFRPLSDITMFVQAIPELTEIIGAECLSDMHAVLLNIEHEDNSDLAIKAAYEKIMRTDPEMVARYVNNLRDRLANGAPLVTTSRHPTKDVDKLTEVYLRLATEFPGDVGCLSLFFLNYIQLEPGKAIYLEANLPHAYLSGDCVECMACSDNVVRAGLTPKYKDVDCLLEMLNYEPRSAAELLFEGDERLTLIGDRTMGHQPQVTSFCPPIPDFAVDRIEVPTRVRAFLLSPIPSASILLILKGSGSIARLPSTTTSVDQEQQNDNKHTAVGQVLDFLEFTRGSIIFLDANVPCCLHQSATAKNPILAFRAYVNLQAA